MATVNNTRESKLVSVSPAAAKVIADKLERALAHTRVLALALTGSGFDGCDEMCHVLYRGVEDDLHQLLHDLTGDYEGDEPKWVCVAQAGEVAHG